MKRSTSSSTQDIARLAEDVARLSQLLTRERDTLPAAYLADEGLRNAYLVYYLPANRSKIMLPLQELARHTSAVFAQQKLRVLDIGSGPGTALLGVLEFFSSRTPAPQLECFAVDQVAENLKAAELLFADARSVTSLDAVLKTTRSDIEAMARHLSGAYDLIILSNVLNEIAHNDEAKLEKRVALLKELLLRHLAEHGSCIIIEPSLRETSRDLLQVRDSLASNGLHVYSPCLFSTACPALVNPKDWCHEDRPWDPPEVVKEIDKKTGLRKDSLKFSYLVLRKDGLSLSDICGRTAFRVVSEPLVSKGKIEYYVCGQGVRKLITRQDKDTSIENELYSGLLRGDVLLFEGLLDEGKRLKVVKGTTVAYASNAQASERPHVST